MNNRIVFITGATAGIGLATAKQLGAMGAHIYFTARSEEKAKAARQEIMAAAGHTHVQYYLCDLASQKSIREMATRVKQDLPVIDVLINNAGCVYDNFTLTEDGIEATIATNHFAYFLLTNLLLENIQRSDYARIVNVASGSHYSGKIDVESFTQNKGYFVMKAYAQSKLANVLFTKELARRLSHTHVTANCLHPGVVLTGIGDKNTGRFTALAWKLFTAIGGIPTDKGAATSVYLASSPGVKGISGKYFDKCREKKPAKLALDESLQKLLWQESLKLCRL